MSNVDDNISFQEPIDLHIDYAKELNEQQYAAVTAPPGPSLVIAGAGSGKTRTLTYRVAFLIEQGIPPERILLLTFTNKAAREMMHRVADLLGTTLHSLWGGTFHSVGARVLRRNPEAVGFQKDFSILDTEDDERLLKLCLANAENEFAKGDLPKPEVLLSVLSMALNTRKSISQTIRSHFPYLNVSPATMERIHELYAQRKKESNAMSFDDLLGLWLHLLQSNPDVLDYYQRRFQFILVDEYQDTNQIQADIIDLLAAHHKNVMVVGDDSQSIYAWRGANYRNILDFPKRYPEVKTYKIETNYRSTPEILTVANAAIKPNEHQFEKELAAARASGAKPTVVVCKNPEMQAVFAAQEIIRLYEEGTALANMAILYRSHFHAMDIQLALTRMKIPFSITSGIRFFEQAHIKDATAYMRVITNPRDELAFRRLVEMLPGVGPKAAQKLWALFSQTRQTLIGGMPDPVAQALRACTATAPKKALKEWNQFVETMAQLESPEVRSSPKNALKLIQDAGYDDYLKTNYDDFPRRTEDITNLAIFSEKFKDMDEFLTQLALLTNVEAEASNTAETERIRLTTIHQAKGLEFDVVFVIMLCEGYFPSERSLEKRETIEEERRLFYVAVTRARNHLYLLCPKMRYTNEYPMMLEPSRFLSDVPAELVDRCRIEE